MPFFSLDAAVEGVRKAVLAPDLFEHLHEVFGLRRGVIDALDHLEEQASRCLASPSPSPLDMYDLSTALSLASGVVCNAFRSVPGHEELLRKAQSVSVKDVKICLEDMGEAAFSQHQSLVQNIQTNCSEIEKSNNAAFKIENARCVWIQKEVQKKRKNSERYKQLSEEISKVNSELSNLWKEPESPMRSLKTQKLSNQSTKLLREKISLEEEIDRNVVAEAENIFPGRKQARELCRQAQTAKVEYENRLFQAVTGNLAEASGISEEQAVAWAENNILVAENARNKLRRIGYPLEQLKKDAAELYRYVGGKIGPIEFILEGRSTRAFARGKTVISVQGSFNKQTLFHECGHLVEAWDTSSQAACLQFIADRAKGSPTSLKKLTGGRYRTNERAYPDDFYNAYVGKYYSDGATEVFSMGLQCLSSPQALALLAVKDPEHLKLMLGICGRSNPSLAKQLNEAITKVAERSKEIDRNKSWKKALDKASNSDFGKLLAAEEGYKGYWLESWGRGATLCRQGSAGWKCMTMGKTIDMRHVAYLMIAHDEGLLPVRYDDPRTACSLLEKSALSGVAPGWYDPAVSLPKV